MSTCVIIVGLPVQVQPADQLALAPDACGNATVNGCSIRSLSHLPGGIAVIEYADGLVLIPWSLLNALLQQAASQLCAERGVV